MWYTNPEFWASAAAVLTAVGGLLRATHAKTRADDAHAIAVGHALDRSWHPNAPRPVGGRRPPAPPSSPAGPSSG
jgi:hypothetical protein